jgi:hypothetical protein
MSRRRSLIKAALALGLIALAALAVLLWQPVRQAMALATLRSVTHGRVDAECSIAPSPVRAWVDSCARQLCSLLDRGGRYRFHNAYGRHQANVLGDIDNLCFFGAERFPPEACEALKRFPHLRSLAITSFSGGGGQPGEAELAHLCAVTREFPDLEQLVLSCENTTDRVLAPLQYHAALRQLFMDSHGLTPRCIETLEKLPQLEVLSMSMAGWSEADVKKFCGALRKRTGLHTLAREGGISDAALAALAGHPGLAWMQIKSDEISPACAATLATMKRLQHVSFLKQSEYTEEEKTAYRAALPGVETDFFTYSP